MPLFFCFFVLTLYAVPWLKKVLNEGFKSYSFKFSRTFKEVFKLDNTIFTVINNNTIDLNTHRELDELIVYVNNVATVFKKNLQKDYAKEYKFLKALDKTFWLIHKRNSSSNNNNSGSCNSIDYQYAPLLKQGGIACPLHNSKQHLHRKW